MNYSVDGLTPKSIERPETINELSDVLSTVHSHGLSAIPWGGGTRIKVGNIPSSYDVAIDLSGFIGKIEHEPGDMTVVVNAGVTLSTLNKLLAAEGQRMPFEVRNPDKATIGCSVASNAPGHRQSSTGGIRDWVIGMQTVLADGTVTKSGGRVVKNVQGYEMHRLNTGAFGTLGIVSQIAFKLVPIPAEQQTIIAWFDDDKTAASVGMSFVNGLFMPEAITLVSGPAAKRVVTANGESLPPENIWALLIRLGGGVRSVERQVNEVVGTVGSQGASGYSVLNDSEASRTWSEIDAINKQAEISARLISRPSIALNTMSAMEKHSEINADSGISSMTDLGFGSTSITANPLNDAESLNVTRLINNQLLQTSGSFVIEACPLSIKQEMDVFSHVGNSINLMRRIKHEFDPHYTLNPGRFVGKI